MLSAKLKKEDAHEEDKQDLDDSLTTSDRYQKILNSHGLKTISASAIGTMQREDFENLLTKRRLTKKQKIVLKDVRTKIRKNMTDRKLRDRRRSFLETHFNLPKNFTNEDTNALLESADLAHIDLTDLTEMDADDFASLKATLNSEQVEVASFLRRRLRNRMHSRRQQAVRKRASKLKRSRWLPIGAKVDLECVRTDDLEEEIRKIECLQNLEEVLAMSTADFLKYKEKYEEAEKMVLSRVRCLGLKRLRNHRKPQNKKRNRTADFKPRVQTSDPLSGLDAELQKYKIPKTAEEILQMDTMQYSDFKKSSRLSKRQCKVLKSIRDRILKRLKHRCEPQVKQEEHLKDDAHESTLDHDSNLDDFTSNNELLDALIDSTMSFELPESFNNVDMFGEHVEKNEDSEDISGHESTMNNSSFPKNKPCSSSYDKTHVQIQDLIDGSKIFAKESTIYPGHAYIYRLRNLPPESSQTSGSIEIYECNSCIEVASTYRTLEARKYVMDTLKTVKVRDGEIIEGDYDGQGHVCVPLELIRKKYNLE